MCFVRVIVWRREQPPAAGLQMRLERSLHSVLATGDMRPLPVWYEQNQVTVLNALCLKVNLYTNNALIPYY